jgi:hypothetical protein
MCTRNVKQITGGIKMSLGRALLFCSFALLAIFGLQSTALATTVTTYDLNVDHCTGTCLYSSYGTVSVTQGVGTLAVDVEITAAGAQLHDPLHSFSFDLSGAAITSTNITYPGFTPPTGVTWAFATFPTQNQDGFRIWPYSLDCTSSLSSNGCGKSLKFTIATTGAFLSHLIDSLSIYFIADITSTVNGVTRTGMVGATECPGICGTELNTPLPSAIILFGSALAGLGLLGVRRRRNQAHAIA